MRAKGEGGAPLASGVVELLPLAVWGPLLPLAKVPAHVVEETYLDRAEGIARFEDLSERTDAIIRHASFLESQIRILSDQLADSRAFTSQVVREEMIQMLDRLERSLSAPPQPRVDPIAKMLDVVRSQLSFYTQRSGGGGGGGPVDRKQPPPPAQPNAQKRPSI